MSFSRITLPLEFASGNELTRNLISIGFKLAGKASRQEPNIEETLVAASLEGVAGDYRVLSLLTDWFDVHSPRVNADHLFRIINEIENLKVKKYWTALAQWKKTDIRFKKISSLSDGERMVLSKSSSDFLMRKYGEDIRFKDTDLIVHSRLLRHRLSDIVSPSELAMRHRSYHHRVLIGPTYRADLIAALEREPEISVANLARTCYSSFSAAWQAKADFELLKKVSSN